MTKSEIADENLGKLFGISLENNHGCDKDFMDILQKYIFGEVFATGELDIKVREMLTVVSLVAQQTLPQLKAHINGALNAGVTVVELREAIYQCAPFAGFPKTLNALSVFDEIVKDKEGELRSSTVIDENLRYEVGLKIQQNLYGDENDPNLSNFPKNLGKATERFFTEVCFGDFYARNGLGLRIRELITMSILVTLGNFSVLKKQINGCLKAGNSVETILAAIIQVMPYVGFPNGMEALKIAKEIFNF